MIDFNYTAPELLSLRIQEVLEAPSEPHRIGGVVYVPEGGGDSSRYSELFGTPERAARTLARFSPLACSYCALHSTCGDDQDKDCLLCDYAALLEWMRGDAR